MVEGCRPVSRGLKLELVTCAKSRTELPVLSSEFTNVPHHGRGKLLEKARQLLHRIPYEVLDSHLGMYLLGSPL